MATIPFDSTRCAIIPAALRLSATFFPRPEDTYPLPMPIDLRQIPSRLQEAAANGTLVPFVGAGLSRHAKVKSRDAFPTWSQLLGRLTTVAVAEKVITQREAREID